MRDATSRRALDRGAGPSYGRVVALPPPKPYEGKQVNTPIRLGDLLLGALDALADERDESRSELIRHFIRAGLVEAGYWPPKAKGDETLPRPPKK